MKKVMLAASILFGAALYAHGDYNSPTGWDSSPYFTYQSWTFSSNANPSAPDTGYENPYGTPSSQFNAGTWMSDLSSPYGLTGRQGGWLISGATTKAQEPALAVITIPNQANAGLTKQVWVQATLSTNNSTLEKDISLKIEGTGFSYFSDTTDIKVLDASVGLIQATMLFSVTPQPASESIVLRADLASDQFLLFDRIDVASIPEPSTFVLLGVGLFSLLVYAWRRRRS